MTPDPMRDVFGPVPWRDVRSLAGPVIESDVDEDTELVREGEVVATFSLIRSGTAELRLGAITIGTLGPGDWFGESDPLARRPQPFAIVARTPMRVLTFSAFGIDRLCAAIPEARRRILDYQRARGDREESGPAGPSSAAALPQGGGIVDGDGSVIGGDPSELTHQPQRAGDRLARRAGPPRELVLGQR
jgi:hypothetical protein